MYERRGTGAIVALVRQGKAEARSQSLETADNSHFRILNAGFCLFLVQAINVQVTAIGAAGRSYIDLSIRHAGNGELDRESLGSIAR